jgi:hypothetical protein
MATRIRIVESHRTKNNRTISVRFTVSAYPLGRAITGDSRAGSRTGIVGYHVLSTVAGLLPP